MRVSWFATAGAFDSDHTGNVEANYRLTSTTNGWKSPATPGPVFMWVVLHDSRGGLSWQSFQLAVR
jgi:gamma-glutamyltranspeptidase